MAEKQYFPVAKCSVGKTMIHSDGDHRAFFLSDRYKHRPFRFPTEPSNTESDLPESEDDSMVVNDLPQITARADMDEERHKQNVQNYYCRLHEVRNWLAECLNSENIPPALELEETLRSGVLLAKLGHFFAPELVPVGKIFDADESRLHKDGFHYRHTDNINLWRRACLAQNLNAILLPDPSDIYAGRNTRTIFALLSLAQKLYKSGRAPGICDQSSTLKIAEKDFEAVDEKIGAEADNFAGLAVSRPVDEELTSSSSGRSSPSNISVDMSKYFNDDGLPESKLRKALKQIIAERKEEHLISNLLTAERPAMDSLRTLMLYLDEAEDVYGEEIELEQQKLTIIRVIESNQAMEKDFAELNENIALLVKNFRKVQDKRDEKAEKERRRELEKQLQTSLSYAEEESDDSGAAESIYDGDDQTEVSSRCSHHASGSRPLDRRLAADLLLETKILVLDLLKWEVPGENVRELTLTRNYGKNEEHRLEIEERQQQLGVNLTRLSDQRREFSEKNGFADVLTNIGWDIRHEKERATKREELKSQLSSISAEVSKTTNNLLAQLSMYKVYEEQCLKNMIGGAPSIKLTDECARQVNKKIKKLLTKKLKSVGKRTPVTLNHEQLIKKCILFMDDTTTPKKVAKYSVRITPCDEFGTYSFEALLNGKCEKKQKLSFEQVLRRVENEDFRMPFIGPLVFDSLGLKRYLDRKFHLKTFE